MPPTTYGLHHLGLATPDVEATAAFFVEHLDFEVRARRPERRAIFVGDGTITLTLWELLADETRPFDRFANAGLHHLALKVGSDAELDALHERLAAAGVEIQTPPELLGDGPTRHMFVFEPGGLRIELIHPAG